MTSPSPDERSYQTEREEGLPGGAQCARGVCRAGQRQGLRLRDVRSKARNSRHPRQSPNSAPTLCFPRFIPQLPVDFSPTPSCPRPCLPPESLSLETRDLSLSFVFHLFFWSVIKSCPVSQGRPHPRRPRPTARTFLVSLSSASLLSRRRARRPWPLTALISQDLLYLVWKA